MWGIAPTSPQSEGSEFVFVLSGANELGYAGTQTNLTIVLGEGKLSLSTSSTKYGSALQTVNATVGIELNYTIPTDAIAVDGQGVRNSQQLNMRADTSEAGSWLSFDATTRTLTGTPPSDVIMDSPDPTAVDIPVTVTDSLGESLTFTLPLTIYPAIFSNDTLPNVYVDAGQPFSASLSDYIRNSDQANITASYSPSNASSWISYDVDTLVLSGTAPSDLTADSKVAVTLTNLARTEGGSANSLSRRDTASNQAVFFVALNGTDAGSPTSTGGSIPAGDGTGPAAAEKRKRVIAGAVVGTIIGLLLIALLIFLCLRRRKRREAEGRAPASSVATKSPALSSSDERTLRDETSPAFIAAPFKKMMNKEGTSPATLYGGSPFLHADGKTLHQEQAVANDGSELRGILITSDRYARQSGEQGARYSATGAGTAATGPYDEDVYGDSVYDQQPERPQQHGMMSALVGGAKRRQEEEEAARIAAGTSHGRSQSAGLGLTGVGMDASDSGEDDPYRQRNAHARSRMSLRSSVSKESWEDDLFYEDNARDSRAATAGSFEGIGHSRTTSVNPLNAITEESEVPRRRGDGRVSSRHSHMRHRSAHVKTSPTFAATAAFAAPASDESEDYDRSYGGDHRIVINGAEDGEGAQHGSTNDFVIGTAQRVDVRELGRNGSVSARTPQLRYSHGRNESMHADAQPSPSGAFEDAEDEAQPLPQGAWAAPQGRSNRDSAFSTMTTDSNMMALSPYISYPEPGDNDDAMSASVYSPRPPSLFGGASIASNVRPEDTLRAVDYSKKTGPPSPLLFPPSQAHLRPANRAASPTGQAPVVPPLRPQSAIVPEELEATVALGERIRIKLTPPGGPSMRGAAGSAGTRAGQKGKYVPLLDNVMMKAHGTWPLWLSEWVFWDPNMFELSGEVPLDFHLGEVTIALVHRRPVATYSRPGSPKRLGGHRRQDSNDMTVEDEVVARLTLIIKHPHPGAYDNNVPLQRGVTGTAF
jgi:axial budding pattern protein 2